MITTNQINRVVKAIVAGYHPEKIILFGSYASGVPTRDSDLDLLLIKDDPSPPIQRNRAARSFLRDFLIPVDVIVKSRKEYEAHKDIVGTVVYMAHKYGRVLL